MTNSKFKILLNEINHFNNYEFRKLQERVNQRIKKKRISNILETPKNELLCPFCNSRNHIRWGKRNDMQRYKCKTCTKTFNSLTKTPLARLRRKGHWLEYSNCLKNELTIREAANVCGIHKNTSFRWRHRFITNFKFIKAKKIGGIIESGQLSLKESFKGIKKDKDKLLRPRKDVFVIYGIDRNNNIFDVTNKGFNTEILNKEFNDIILNDSLVFSENKKAFVNYLRKNNYKHVITKDNKHELSHINKVNQYRIDFKEWILDYFKGVATKYLENYVSWYRALNEFNSGINALTILYRAKAIEKYRHQPLKVTRFI